MTDLKYAVRSLRKRPAFTAVAVLTLGLGIGANTAIFSVVNGVLLRALPYPDAGRIVLLSEQTERGNRIDVSHPNFVDWRERARSFDAMAVYSGGTESVLGGREAVFAEGYAVSDGFFRVFGVAPAIGRTFVVEEMREGGVPAVVVTHRFWQDTLGGQTDLSRLRIIIAGMSAQVVGVMPAGFAYPAGADLWAPAELFGDDTSRTAHNYSVAGRLKAGVSVTQAAAEMNAIAAQLKQQYGSDENAVAVATVPLRDALTSGSRDMLLLLLGAVGLVLLIACANVAATMLARGEERRIELAVRAALGAARLRLVRQLLIESLLIGTLAAVTGLLLAQWLVPALLALNAVAVPPTAGIVLDARVLLFTFALAIVTPLLFGLIPSLQASRADLPEVLAQGGRGSSAPTRARVRAILVASEVAIAVILLVGSSLLLHSFANVMSVERGFETSGAITATMAIPGTKYPAAPRAAMFYQGLLERIRQIPDVAAAGAVNQMPLAGGDFGGGLRFEDSGGTTSGYTASAGYRVATPGYLEALGVRVVQGRTLDESDRPGRSPSAVVNEAFVRQYLAARNPIGVRFNYAGMDPVNPVFTIVGVVGDVHHRSLVRAPAPEVFVCAYQQPFRTRWKMTALIRTANSAHQNTLAVAVRQAVRDFDPEVPVELSTLEHVVDASVADRRFMLMVLGTFAAIALVLAATGIYGVLSQSVAQRTQEIGIRIALGADARSVLQLAIGSAMKAVLIGLAVGAFGAVATVRLIQSFLFNVKPADPISFAGATLLLLTVGFVAAYLPARRATRVDPLLALRAQ